MMTDEPEAWQSFPTTGWNARGGVGRVVCLLKRCTDTASRFSILRFGSFFLLTDPFSLKILLNFPLSVLFYTNHSCLVHIGSAQHPRPAGFPAHHLMLNYFSPGVKKRPSMG